MPSATTCLELQRSVPDCTFRNTAIQMPILHGTCVTVSLAYIASGVAMSNCMTKRHAQTLRPCPVFHSLSPSITSFNVAGSMQPFTSTAFNLVVQVRQGMATVGGSGHPATFDALYDLAGPTYPGTTCIPFSVSLTSPSFLTFCNT